MHRTRLPSPPSPLVRFARAVAAASLPVLAAACSQAPDSLVGEPLPAAAGTTSGDDRREPAAARIPERFQGEWQRDPAACGRPDEGRLVIGPALLRFHESTGALQALQVEGARLDVALRMRGEGASWDATYRFRLSDDGRRLADLSSGNGMVRLRCA
jgi:hypothetical protein